MTDQPNSTVSTLRRGPERAELAVVDLGGQWVVNVHIGPSSVRHRVGSYEEGVVQMTRFMNSMMKEGWYQVVGGTKTR